MPVGNWLDYSTPPGYAAPPSYPPTHDGRHPSKPAFLPSAPAYPPPPSPPSAVNELLDVLKSAANSLGLDFLVAFAETAYPATREAVRDAPTAAYYITKLLQHGLDPSLADPNGDAATALYGILQSTFQQLLSTDTGSIIADYMLQHDLDLGRLAAARDMSELLQELRRAYWWGQLYDSAVRDYLQYMHEQQSRGITAAELGSTFIVGSVMEAFIHIVWEAVVSTGRLTPVSLAADVVAVAQTLVGATVERAAGLRWAAESVLYMSDAEWFAFVNLQTNLWKLEAALSNLAASLSRYQRN